MPVENLNRAKGGWIVDIDGIPWVRSDQGVMYTVDASTWSKVFGDNDLRVEIDGAIEKSGYDIRHGSGGDVFLDSRGQQPLGRRCPVDRILRFRVIKRQLS